MYANSGTISLWKLGGVHGDTGTLNGILLTLHFMYDFNFDGLEDLSYQFNL